MAYLLTLLTKKSLTMNTIQIKEKDGDRWEYGVASIKGGGNPGKGNAESEGGGC
jgi:hypothetical protein